MTTERKPIGRLAIVLHSHMPYVLGHGVWPFGEQWLWEAVIESYTRLVDVIGGHAVTLGVTPVLADQLEEMRGEAGDRFTAWVADSIEHIYGEDMGAFRQVDRPDLHAALGPQLEDHRRAVRRFANEFDRDLIGMIDQLGATGTELIAGPATHPLMPLLASDFGRDLQLSRGLASHARRFGAARGIWLPECAWDRGLDTALARNGVEYFCVDQSARFGVAALENLEPVATPAGPVAIPIDWHTIAQVWSDGSYPASDAYRSTFKRTIHDLMPWDNTGAAWNPAAARAQAEAHADTFLRALAARLEVYASERGSAGTCVFAADTELFGHWWYEGPWWLESVLEKSPDYGIELVTLAQVVDGAAPAQRTLARSSWGKNKDLSTWDCPMNSELTWAQRRAELDLEASAARGDDVAQRELLALQASDWAFLDEGGRTDDYGARRVAGHLSELERAISGQIG